MGLLAGDRIHPGHEGSLLSVEQVQDAVDRLAVHVKPPRSAPSVPAADDD